MKIFKKRYAIYGMVEQSCVFPLGNGQIRVNFQRGSLTTSGVVPATFTTTNSAIQQVIEKSSKFKDGFIKLDEEVLYKDTGEEANLEVTNKEGNGDTSGSVHGDTPPAGTFPDVKNSQQAKDILLGEPFNVALVELGNKTAILTKAEELGVSFPNWK